MEVECGEPPCPQGVNGTGLRHQRHIVALKPSSPYETNGAANQAKHTVKITFKLSVVDCSVSLNVISLTVGDGTSKKQ